LPECERSRESEAFMLVDSNGRFTNILSPFDSSITHDLQVYFPIESQNEQGDRWRKLGPEYKQVTIHFPAQQFPENTYCAIYDAREEKNSIALDQFINPGDKTVHQSYLPPGDYILEIRNLSNAVVKEMTFKVGKRSSVKVKL